MVQVSQDTPSACRACRRRAREPTPSDTASARARRSVDELVARACRRSGGQAAGGVCLVALAFAAVAVEQDLDDTNEGQTDYHRDLAIHAAAVAGFHMLLGLSLLGVSPPAAVPAGQAAKGGAHPSPEASASALTPRVLLTAWACVACVSGAYLNVVAKASHPALDAPALLVDDLLSQNLQTHCRTPSPRRRLPGYHRWIPAASLSLITPSSPSPVQPNIHDPSRIYPSRPPLPPPVTPAPAPRTPRRSLPFPEPPRPKPPGNPVVTCYATQAWPTMRAPS